MNDDWRLEWLGDAALSVHAVESSALAANACVHRLARRLRAAGVAGVRDVVPGMWELVVHVDPLRCDVRQVALALRATDADRDVTHAGPVVDVPVVYGGQLGPDLDDVALACGLDPEDVCQRHAAVEYVVCFVGFLPGFPYLGPLDTRLRLPRRATPRPKVPPGSVAIAGEYSGIYPWASPGGWHIIGHTDMSLFDSRRDATDPADAGDACPVRQRRVRAAMSGRGLLVVRAGLHTTVQDEGRWGHQHLGVPVGGALDLDALRRANTLVGNAPGEAALEVTLVGCALRAEVPLHVAVTGATFDLDVDGRPVATDSQSPGRRRSPDTG